MGPTEGAADRVAPAGTAGQDISSASIGEPGAERKQLDLGNCIRCEQRIRLAAGATACQTCSAWRRWASAFRVAARALRGERRKARERMAEAGAIGGATKGSAGLHTPSIQNAGRTSEKLAEKVGVSARTIDKAIKVREKGVPELNAAVAAGEPQ